MRPAFESQLAVYVVAAYLTGENLWLFCLRLGFMLPGMLFRTQ